MPFKGDMRILYSGFEILGVLACSLAGLWAQNAPGTAAPETICVRGKVVDFKTGEALGKTLVSIRAQRLDATTDGAGRFELCGVRPGVAEFYVSTVGYGLLKKRIDLGAADQELELQIGEEALKRNEQVNVTASAFDPVEAAAPTERTLHSADLRNLSSALMHDPVRSVQSLPGVAASDDFYAEFAYRGAGISKIGFYIDGVPLKNPFHSLQQITDLGSVSLLNGDLIESVSLLGGAFPAKYANRTAAVLSVQTREPGREKVSTRVNADFFGASITSEGPLDRARKGAWLVTVRKSYLQYLIARLDENGLGIGYYDTEGKLDYDPARGHRLSALLIHGSAAVDRDEDSLSRTLTTRANGQVDTLRTTWQWTPKSAVLRTSVFYNRDAERHRNNGEELLLRSNAHEAGFRHDATILVSPHHTLEAGVEATRSVQSYAMYFPWDFALGVPGPNMVALSDFSAGSWRTGAYFQEAWTALSGRLSIVTGGRFDRFSYNRESTWSPRANVSLALSPRTKIMAGYGQYWQNPDFVQLLGTFGNTALVGQRATHYIAGLEHRATSNFRIRAELYDREEKHLAYSPETEWRLEGNQIRWARPGARLEDSMRGYSRGVEFTLERRSANRLSGWISYSYGHSRYHDPLSGLAFDADYDQRHTINAYASYRLSKSLNVSTKYRYGSNFPVMGFFRGNAGSEPENLYLSDKRNQVRIPPYSRLDLRMNKACHFKRSKLTLYAEVANVLNRKQWRYQDANTDANAVDFATGRIWVGRSKMLPILPSGGFTLEF